MSEEHQCLVITRPGGTKKGISFGGHYSQQKRGMTCFFFWGGGRRLNKKVARTAPGAIYSRGGGLFILG